MPAWADQCDGGPWGRSVVGNHFSKLTLREFPVRSTTPLRLTGLAAVLFALTSCAPDTGISVPLDSYDLPKCEEVKVTAEQLAEFTHCNLEGVDLVFPDGRIFEIPALAVSFGSHDTGQPIIKIDNLGSLGVVASEKTGERFTIWGNQDGIVAVLEVTPAEWSLPGARPTG